MFFTSSITGFSNLGNFLSLRSKTHCLPKKTGDNFGHSTTKDPTILFQNERAITPTPPLKNPSVPPPKRSQSVSNLLDDTQNHLGSSLNKNEEAQLIEKINCLKPDDEIYQNRHIFLNYLHVNNPKKNNRLTKLLGYYLEQKIKERNEKEVQEIQKGVNEVLDITTRNQKIPVEESTSSPSRKAQPLPPWLRTTARLISNTDSGFSDDELLDIKDVKEYDKQQVATSMF